MTDSKVALGRIDLDIAKAFDPEAGEEIDKRLDRVKQLFAIRKEMIAMELKTFDFRGSISRIFSSEGYRTYDDDISRWKEMKEIREQMAELHIDTTVIDTRITNIFGVPIHSSSLHTRQTLTPTGTSRDAAELSISRHSRSKPFNKLTFTEERRFCRARAYI